MLNSSEVWSEENSFFEKTYLISKQQNTLANFAKSIEANRTLVEKELHALKLICHEENQSILKYILYRCLTVFGGIYAFFASFDGMLAVLTALLPMMHMALMISLVLLAAFSGLGVFLARDKITIAEALDISEEYRLDLMNDYLFHLAKYYDKQFLTSLDDLENLEILQRISHIRAIKELLLNKSEVNKEIISKPANYIQTQLMITIGAILFFSDGFFIGQGLALCLAPLMCINPILFIFVAGIILGFMALSAFWFVEKPYVERYLYQDLFTDESNVQASLERISNHLKNLEKWAYIRSETGDAKKAEASPLDLNYFSKAATAGSFSPSR